jgi:hypothetical protein
MVRPGVCRGVRARLDLRIPTRSLAFRIGGEHLETNSDLALGGVDLKNYMGRYSCTRRH